MFAPTGGKAAKGHSKSMAAWLDSCSASIARYSSDRLLCDTHAALINRESLVALATGAASSSPENKKASKKAPSPMPAAGAGLGEYVASVRFVSFHSAPTLGAALPTAFLQKLANLSALYLTACGLVSIQGTGPLLPPSTLPRIQARIYSECMHGSVLLYST